MKWETDWLYRLIMRDIEQIWQRAEKDSIAVPDSPAPDYLIISQFSTLSTQSYAEYPSKLQASLVAPIIQQWIFDATGVRSGSTSPAINPIRGMFFQVGMVNFSVSSDRKLVFLCYMVGPRYGQSRVFRVLGQGCKGRLIPHQDFISLQY